MQPPGKQQEEMLKIPRWLARFITRETKTQPNNQQLFLAILHR
jgi:hypothetical protein